MPYTIDRKKFDCLPFHQIPKLTEFYFLPDDGEPHAPVYIVPMDGDYACIARLIGELSNPEWETYLDADLVDPDAPCLVKRQPVFSDLQFGDYFVFADQPEKAPAMWIDGNDKGAELFGLGTKDVINAKHIRPDAPIRLVHRN